VIDRISLRPALRNSRQTRLLVRRALLAAALVAGVAAPSPATRWAIEIQQSGVYRVEHAALAAALGGPPRAARLPSARLGLRNEGRPVALAIEDGGDGSFDAGDALIFRGEQRHGASTWFDPYAQDNVYVLDSDDPAPERIVGGRAAASGTAAAAPALTRHLEEDSLLLRFPGAGTDTGEQWFWAKLSHADPQPFRVKLDLPGIDGAAGTPVQLKLSLSGWSRPPRSAEKDHSVEVRLGDRLLTTLDWNNGEPQQPFDIPGLTAADVARQPLLTLRVPVRRVAGASDPIVDVVVVNWIEVRYPWDRALSRGQVRLAPDDAVSSEPSTGSPGGSVAIPPAPAGTSWRAFTDAQTMLDVAQAGAVVAARSVDLVAPGGFLSADAVRPLGAARLRRDDLQADYLIVSAPELAAAVEPLAAYHRERGLRVEVATIDQVYDEFGDSLPHPKAVRGFLEYTYRHWKAPAPRFVLLVGDASWDIRNQAPDAAQYPDMAYQPVHGTAFARVESTAYRGGAHRNLVPTWSYGTYDGHAAGDNWFVAFDGDDRPKMAIGRFPVVTADELTAVIDKTLSYSRNPPPGDWRRRVLWIANEEPAFQKWSSDLATWLDDQGFASERFFPHPDAERDPQRQEPAKLRAELDTGNLLVHFVGHGGRFIWRTGPADWTKHRDLFGLPDIDQLTVNPRLPVVLSMTCYSAPFDHPTADSIGEKLLREPGRGAVAVIAASWRNAPHRGMSEGLLKEILGAPTLGEAVQRAKMISGDRDFREQYNLLGDPALVLPLPTAAAHTASSPDSREVGRP
jgi:hypothetical protein